MNSTNIDTLEQTSKMTTTFNNLCDSMSSVRISCDTAIENNPITIAVKHDVLRLLRAHDCGFSCQEGFVYLMPNMLSSPMMIRSFLFKFPSEAEFYKEIEKRISQHLSSAYLLEIMPLIDEYIEHVFSRLL